MKPILKDQKTIEPCSPRCLTCDWYSKVNDWCSLNDALVGDEYWCEGYIPISECLQENDD